MLVLAGAIFAVPAAAQATDVTVRIEASTGPLLEESTITLPTSPVAPAGAADGQTCAPDSVIGALDAATGGNWAGQWSDTTGWSIDTVKGVDALQATGRRWVVYLGGSYLNDAPCNKTLTQGQELLFYPLCTTATTKCFSGGPLDLRLPAQTGPGGFFNVAVFESKTTFSDTGIGATTAIPSTRATVYTPEGTATTDQYYGTASISLSNRGPAKVTVQKLGRVPDRGTICVTDGEDGYCGTPTPTPQPFNPLDFCQTTGDDGECGSPDHKAPVGRIANPMNGRTYSAGSHPNKFSGTVDRDPSEVVEVQLRVYREAKVTVNKVVGKRKVKVKKRIHGKLVTKRVTKKKYKKVRVTRCYGWNITASTWKQLKKCDIALAPVFKATGDEIWSFEFINPIPSGRYTLDAYAKDGVGNVDSVPEAGRNRVTFTAA